MKNKWNIMAAATVAAALTAVPAQAANGCWNPVEQAAAKVRDLQTRLMDATLRCQMIGVDVTPAYNDFVRANRTTIQGANSVLRARFVNEGDYDHYVTSLANASANGASTTRDSCADTVALAAAGVAAAGDVTRLVALEEQSGWETDLPGGGCAINFAVVAAAAPAVVPVSGH